MLADYCGFGEAQVAAEMHRRHVRGLDPRRRWDDGWDCLDEADAEADVTRGSGLAEHGVGPEDGPWCRSTQARRPARVRAGGSPRGCRSILTAAHSLIAEKGVASLRIAELTDRAGVALGSFQNHFASKEELVEAVVQEAVQALAAEIVETPAAEAEPAAVAIAALRKFVRLAYDDPEFCRLLVNLSRSEELFVESIRPYAETALTRAVQAGVFEIDDMDIAVTSIVAGGLAIIRRILDGHLDDDADIRLARMTLLSLGVDAQEARRLSILPLP